MKVKDVMTKNVAYVNPNSSVVEAAQLMQKHNVGSIPVCDNQGVIGIVTDRDIVVRNVAHGTNPQSTSVQSVMTSQVTTVSSDMDVNEVSKIMSQNQIRRIPVVDNNKLVGILALGDLATQASFDTEISNTLAGVSSPSRPEQMPKS